MRMVTKNRQQRNTLRTYCATIEKRELVKPEFITHYHHKQINKSIMLSENLVKDGELHHCIEGEGTKCFFGKVPSQLSNQTPNCLSTKFDDILWNDFKSRLNSLISQINRWLRLIFFIHAVAIIGTIVLCMLLDEQQIFFALIGLFYCLTICISQQSGKM